MKQLLLSFGLIFSAHSALGFADETPASAAAPAAAGDVRPGDVRPGDVRACCGHPARRAKGRCSRQTRADHFR